MSEIERLGIPPKEARDKFNGNEKIIAAMIESEEIQNLDKVKGAKRKIDIEIAREDAKIAKADDNMVYELEDGTITHEKPSNNKKSKKTEKVVGTVR